MTDETQEIRDDRPDESPEPVAFTAEQFRAMQAEIARLRADNVRERAVAFAKEVSTGADARVLPALRKQVEEAYERAAAADAALPEPVSFTDGTAARKGTHVEAFRSLILALPRLGVAGAKASGSGAEVGFTALEVEPPVAAPDEDDDLVAAARSFAEQRNGRPRV